jgi:small subunit ribosomal protein S20
MANTKSSMKRARQTLKRSARNSTVRTSLKSAIKKAREAVASGDKTKAEAAFREATAMIDRSRSKGVIHARNASRRVARLAHLVATKLKK